MTDKEFDYILNFEAKISNFYGLPKVHKSKQINEKNVKCQTHRLSNLIDMLLRPYTRHVTSYLRETTNFLSILPKTIPNDAILASFDIESLHSNILHATGLKAVDYWLSKHLNILNSRFSKDFILDGIQSVLENNIFCFNNMFMYIKQNKGTTMGTKFAPVYVTVTIGYLQEKLCNIIEAKYDTEFYHDFKKYWKGFLDDCFIPWTKTEEDLKFSIAF